MIITFFIPGLSTFRRCLNNVPRSYWFPDPRSILFPREPALVMQRHHSEAPPGALAGGARAFWRA
jgi:hypothetical protein